MTRRGNVIAAFSVSPLASIVPVIIYTLAEGSRATPGALIITSAVVVVCAYLAIVVLGIPAYLVYRSKGIESVWAYLLGAFLIGVVAAFLLTAPFTYDTKYPTLELILISGFGGACAGLVFWWFVKSPPNNRFEKDMV